MSDVVLVTGGSGKTARRVTSGLRARSLTPRVASRSATGAGAVRFDWADPGTFDAALVDVTAAYLVAPTSVADPQPLMEAFLGRAVERGVRRFVLLSASSLLEDGPLMGGVHGWLRRNTSEWTVLRPTWFMQNFSESHHLPTIRHEGAIYSATGHGRVGFIDAADIADVAVTALTEPGFENGDRILTGPELLSYDDVASRLSVACGRRIEHRALTEHALADRLAAGGLPANYAPILAAMDTAIAGGSEERLSPAVEQILGRSPRSFSAFAEGAAAAWKKPEVR